MHSAGKFSEAVEKYERAKGNVASFVTAPAVELRKACTLNLSSCYLNLKQYGNCVVQCGEVLAGGRQRDCVVASFINQLTLYVARFTFVSKKQINACVCFNMAKH